MNNLIIDAHRNDNVAALRFLVKKRERQFLMNFADEREASESFQNVHLIAPAVRATGKLDAASVS